MTHTVYVHISFELNRSSQFNLILTSIYESAHVHLLTYNNLKSFFVLISLVFTAHLEITVPVLRGLRLLNPDPDMNLRRTADLKLIDLKMCFFFTSYLLAPV